MRSFLVGALLLAASASQASAQISFTSSTGAPDPGYGSQTLITGFNAPTPGVVLSGNYSIQTGLLSGLAAAPAGDASAYFSVPDANGGASFGTAIIDFSGYLGSQSLSSLSFYWGSIDTYNSLRFLDAAGNALNITGYGSFLTGSDIAAPANGDQSIANTNRRVFFDLSGTPTFAKLELTSNGRAFEIDDIAGTTATTVPEPSTYALMAAGLAAVAVVRRRKALKS